VAKFFVPAAQQKCAVSVNKMRSFCKQQEKYRKLTSRKIERRVRALASIGRISQGRGNVVAFKVRIGLQNFRASGSDIRPSRHPPASTHSTVSLNQATAHQRL